MMTALRMDGIIPNPPPQQTLLVLSSYNSSMNKEEILYHLRGRWKEVENIQRQELRATTLRQNWMKLNQIMLRAKRLNLSRGDNDDEIEVFQRWARLKEKYEASRRFTNVS